LVEQLLPTEPTAARRLRATTQGGQHAYRGQARDHRRVDRGSSVQLGDDRLRVSRPQVSEFGEIRRNLRKQNVSYHVVKNRLMKIAAKDAGVEALSILLEGPTAVAFVRGDEGAAAKAVLEAFRPHRMIKVTGAVIGDQVVNADGVTRLAQLPGRDVLLSQVAGAIAAPMANVAGLFDAPLRDVAGLVQALADKQGAA
jgi:large subunit ribosomal protein L10